MAEYFFPVLLLIVVTGWVLFFAVLLLFNVVVVLSRRRGERRRANRPGPPTDLASLAAGLETLQVADPSFDPQLLVDAAQAVTLLLFVAMTTGDVEAVDAMTASSFWETPFGRLVRTVADDRRRRATLYIPLDYQASAPELARISVDSAQQEVRVRVWFSQLQAVVGVGAAAQARASTVSSVTAIPGVLGAAISDRADTGDPEVGWITAGGRYDLTFARPSSSQTDPATALATRVCPACGATYMSQFGVACEHCKADRPLPWGDWRLVRIEWALRGD
jgi:hypothetical protein